MKQQCDGKYFFHRAGSPVRILITLLPVLYTCVVSAAPLRIDGDGGVVAPGLFVPSAAPADGSGLQTSRFFRIDTTAFDRWNPEPGTHLIIPDVPLADGRVARVHAERFTLLAGNAELRINNADSFTPERHILLTGEIDGEPGSHVYLAVFRHAVFGYVRRADGSRAVYAPTGPRSRLCAVTPEQNLRAPGPPPQCHAEQLPEYRAEELRLLLPQEPASMRKGGNSTQGSAIRLNLAVECDYNYYQLNGSSTSGASSYAIAIYGAVSDIYRQDAGIVWYISYMNVWTSNGPYPGPSADSLLTQVRRYWLANHASRPRAAVQLLHGSGIGGLAWVNVLCNNQNGYSVAGVNGGFSYPYSGYIWDLDVCAHELGHGVGSPHTHSCSWNPAVDSCYNAEGTCYSGTNPIHGTIMSYCHLTSMGTELRFHTRVATLLTSRANSASCKITQSVPDVNAGADRYTCAGTPVTIGNAATSGLPPYTYYWWPSTGLSGTSVAQPQANPSLETLYHVQVTDANGFRAYDSVLVSPSLPPLADAGFDGTYCHGIALTIGGAPSASAGTPPYTYVWTPSAGLSSASVANPAASPSVSTTYRLLVTDAHGCSAADSIRVSVGSALTVDAGMDRTICYNTTTVIGGPPVGGTPPFTYVWTPSAGLNDATAETPVASPLTSTTYHVAVTDANGCGATDTVRITVDNPSNQSLVWTGAVNSDWGTRGNWDVPCAVPGTGTHVTIPSGTVSPENIPAVTLGSLSIANSQPMILSLPMTVAGTLALQSGSIVLNGADLTIGSSGSITGANSSNLIVTNDTGKLRQNAVGAGARTGGILFPVGPAAMKYTPVVITNSGTADALSVRVEAAARARGMAGAALADHAVNLSWHIAEAHLGGSNITLVLQWNANDELPLFDRSRAYISRHNGNFWTPASQPGSAAGSDPYTSTATGVMYTGTFSVGDALSPLPVEFLSLSAHPRGGIVTLRWSTAGERHSAGFAIERRTDAEWRTLGFVPSSAAGRGAYSFDDTAPVLGRAAYRLRQIDIDGAEVLSPVVEIDDNMALPAHPSLQVYPHPVSTQATVRLVMPDAGRATVTLHETLGREVVRLFDAVQLEAGAHTATLKAEQLPRGIYHMRLEAAGTTLVRLLILD